MYFQVKFVNRTEQNRTEPLQGFLAEGTRSGSQNRTGFLVKIEQSGLQNRHFQDFIANEFQNRTITRFISFANTKQNIIFNYFKFFYAIF